MPNDLTSLSSLPGGPAFLEAIKTSTPKRIFISYAWGNKDDRAALQGRLELLATDLEAAGHTVFYDLRDMERKVDETMRQNLGKSNVVLPVCTPDFCKRVEETDSNAAFEYRLTLTALREKTKRIFPIRLWGEAAAAVPPELQGLDVYDMTTNEAYTRSVLHRLLPALLGPSQAYQTALSTLQTEVLSQKPALPEPQLLREGVLDAIDARFSTNLTVCLTGPKGMGKTHCALAWAHRHQAAFLSAQENQLPLWSAVLDGPKGDSTEAYQAVFDHIPALVLDGFDEGTLSFEPKPEQKRLFTASTALTDGLEIPALTEEEAVQFLKQHIPDDESLGRLATLCQHRPGALKQAARYQRAMNASVQTVIDVYQSQGILEDMPEEALPQTALTHSGTSTQAFKPLLRYQFGDVFLANLKVWYQGRSVDPKRILIPYTEASSTAQAIQGDLAAIGFKVDTAPFSTEVVQTNPYDVVMPLCTPDFKTVMAGDGRAVQTLISQAHTVIPLFQGGFGVLPEALKQYLAYSIEDHFHQFTSTYAPKGVLPVLLETGHGDSDTTYSQALRAFKRVQLSNLPPANPRFTGRETLLSDIAQALPQTSTENPLVLYGTGGSGKSELALKVAHQQDKLALWIASETQETLYQSFFNLATQLNLNTDKLTLKELATRIYEEIQDWDWLLVFDNAITLEALPLPQTKENQRLLITSRNENWANKRAVGTFSNEEATTFIRQSQPHASEADCKALAQRLGHLPLALNQATAYLTEQSQSIPEYLSHLSEQGLGATIAQTWAVSLATIEAQSPLATTLLLQCAHLAPDAIPLALLKIVSSTENTHALLKALQHLRRYSLLEAAGPDQFKLHRLLQEVLQSQGDPHQRVTAMVEALGPAIGDPDTIQRNIPLFRAFIPHIEQLIAAFDRLGPPPASEETPPQIALAALLGNFGNLVNITRGDAARRKALLERALAICEPHYSQEHPQVARILVSLGAAHGDLGDTHTKKQMLERALAIDEPLYGKSHPRVAQTLANLATAHRALGNYQTAKEMLERALAIQEPHYGKNHPQVAITLVNLANAHGALGDTQTKKEMLGRALPILETLYGKNHPDVAVTLTNLANAHGDLGDHQTAKALLERALAIQEPHFGQDHPDVARTLFSLANAHGDLGDTQTKKQMLERALAIKEAHYGKNHPQVAATLASLAMSEAELLDFEAAERHITQAHQIRVNHHLPLQNMTAEMKTRIFTRRVLLNRFNEAFNQGQFQQAIAFGEEYAKESSIPHRIYHNLACAYHSAGEIKKVEDCFSKAIEATSSADVYTEYALFLFCQKRFEEVLQPIQLALAAEELGGLNYGENEISTVEPFMATLIQEKGQISVTPQHLAHYLKVKANLALNKTSEAKQCLQDWQSHLKISEASDDDIHQRLQTHCAEVFQEREQASVTSRATTSTESPTAQTKRFSLSENCCFFGKIFGRCAGTTSSQRPALSGNHQNEKTRLLTPKDTAQKKAAVES